MASFTPSDTSANPAEINTSAQGLDRVASQLTGHGDDVNAALNNTATSFSEIVSDNIRKLATYNEGAWMAAVQGVISGAAITRHWAINVQDFKTARQNLINQWESAQSGGFGVATPNQAQVAQQATAADPNADVAAAQRTATQQYDAHREQAGQAKAEELNRIFTGQVLEKLHADARDRSAELGREPTDADLQALAAAGALPWAAYVAFPGRDFPPPVSAEEGRRAAQILLDPNSSLADREWARRVLAAVNADAKKKLAAGKGEHLTAGELAYLTALWAGLGPNLEKLGSNSGPQTDFKELGNSLLALSNEKLGGGFNNLPPQVRDLLTQSSIKDTTGEISYSGATTHTLSIANEGQWSALTVLLQGTDIEGGKDFSVNLTHRVDEIIGAYNQTHPGNSLYNSSGLLNDKDHLSIGLQSALAASTRNHDADNVLLTGPEGPKILDHLINFPWNDKGTAASGFVDWIAQDTAAAHASGHEDPRANAAAVRLIQLVDGGDPKDPNSAYNKIFNAVGQNSAFSLSFEHIAEQNLNALAVPASDGGTGVVDGHVQISAEDRRHFLELVAHNDDAYHRFAAQVGSYEGNLDRLAAHGDISQGSAAYRNRILNEELLGSRQDALDRFDGNHQIDRAADANKTAAWVGAGGKALTKLVETIPGAGPIFSILGDVAIDGIKDDVNSAASPPPPLEVDPHVSANYGGNEAAIAQKWVDAGNLTGKIPPDLFSGQNNDGVPQLREPLSSYDRARLLDALVGDPQWTAYRGEHTDVSAPPPGK
jgi:hypothetical protein